MVVSLAGAALSVASKIFGPKSGKTTHFSRFLAAQAAGDTATAKLLIDQAYSHAYIEAIPDKAEWLQVWQLMLGAANPELRGYMNTKMGKGSAPTDAGANAGTPDLSASARAPGAVPFWLVLLLAGGAGFALYWFGYRKK